MLNIKMTLLIVRALHGVKFLFNAAQPGVGRVQVLGSKQVQTEGFVGIHQSSALTAFKYGLRSEYFI